MDASRPLAVGLLTAGLLATGGLAWWLALRPPVVVDASSLAQLPTTLGPWRSSEQPLDQTAERMLEPDASVQRIYRHRLGDVVWLYVGYFGTERGGSPRHLPSTCYLAQGWSVDERPSLEVDADLGLRVNEFLVSQGGEVRLVHFWYRSRRATALLTPDALDIDHLLGRLAGPRADGALVRISTPLGADGLDAARSRLADFAVRVSPQLGEHWPSEQPAAAPS